MIDLRLDDDELSSCVACGLCLPHCPTFRVTGEEGLSPRGRIDAMRTVQWRGGPVDDEFVRFMETCVQCRGCEPACPSGVPFGRLMEGTRAALAAERRTAPRWLRAGYCGARSAPPVARRVERVGGRPTSAPDPGAPRTRPPAGTPGPGPRLDGRRRVVVHRLRHGCVDAADPPGHGRAHHADGIHVLGPRHRWGVLRRPPHPCRAGAAGAAARRAGDPVDAGRCAGARQLRGLRCRDEGLRPPPRQRRGAGVRGPGPRRPRVARRAPRPVAGRRLVGSVR